MKEKNWNLVKEAFLTGEILGILMDVEGKKCLLVGQVHEIDINESKIILDTTKFIQSSLPSQWQDIGVWDIEIPTLEDEIQVVPFSPELLVRPGKSNTIRIQ